MTQTVRTVKVEDSYIPVVPDEMAPQLMDTSYTDRISNPKSIVAYAGKNFLPTSVGYKSYFGTNDKLNIDALKVAVDYILIFQNAAFNTFLIALAEDGIYTKSGEASGAWTKVVVSEVADESYLPWTYTILNNELYCYREGASFIYKFLHNPADVLSAYQPAYPALTLVTSEVSVAGPAFAEHSYWVSFKVGELFTKALPLGVIAAHAVGTGVLVDLGTIPDGYGPEWRLYRSETDSTLSYQEYTTLPIYNGDGTFQFRITGSLLWENTLAALPDLSWAGDINFNLYNNPVAISPSFLNMEAQKGIFRAGIRLGIWDVEGSVAWSSIDDSGDFTPDLNTLAGSLVFADVTGSIVTIVGMGTGFVIYSTKSVVLVRKDLDSAFGWVPTKLLDFGIAYRNQVTTSVDISEHYVYTEHGIFKIAGTEVQPLVPDFYEVVKRTQLPVYLALLSNRYLMVQIMDSAMQQRLVRTHVESIPGVRWKISDEIVSGEDLLALGDLYALSGDAYSRVVGAVANVHGNGADIQGGAAPTPPAKYDGTWQAYYVTNYSMGNVPPAIEWTSSPCPVLDENGARLQFTPSNLLIGANTHKVTFADDPNGNTAYWQNIDKFVATQTAIWAEMDKKRQELLDILNAKTYQGSAISSETSYATPGNYASNGSKYGVLMGDPAGLPAGDLVEVPGTCEMGYIPIAYSAPELYVNNCGAFLIRKCIARAKVVVHTMYRDTPRTVEKNGNNGWHLAYVFNYTGSSTPETILEATPDDALANWPTDDPNTPYYDDPPTKWRASVTPYEIERVNISSGWLRGVVTYFEGGYVRTRHNVNHYLLVTGVETGVFAIDQGEMLVAGWKNSETGALLARTGDACTIPEPEGYKSPDATYSFPGDYSTGNIRGSVFDSEGVDVEGYGPITWPAQSIDLPPAYWLMQQGSPAPAYPTFLTTFAYDTLLKKWGRFDEAYKLLVDYQPVNTTENQIIPYDVFQMKAGVLGLDGTISLFDDNPEQSEIVYGKIGYHRLGSTDLEEVRVQFASASTGTLVAEPSYNGRSPEATGVRSTSFSGATSATLFANLSARWYNVVVSGKYDLTYLEFRGRKAGRR